MPPRAVAPLLALCLPACLAQGIEPPEPTEMVNIPGGVFTFGSDRPCLLSADTDVCQDPSARLIDMQGYYPTVDVELGSFAFDVHEVTNKQYEYCVEMGACEELRFTTAPDRTQEDYYRNRRFWDHPVANVTFARAQEYCAFVGKRLPTEAEWERVAKGIEGRMYPAEGVDNRLDCRDMQISTLYCRGDKVIDRVPLRREDGSWDAPTDDRITVGGQEVFHMMGNLSEWVDDWWDEQVTCRGAGLDKRPPCEPCWKCSGDVVCLEQCEACDACEGDECFYTCGHDPEYEHRTITCLMYPDGPGGYSPETIWPRDGALRVSRGGSVIHEGNGVCAFRSSGREAVDPLDSAGSRGFRCAMSL